MAKVPINWTLVLDKYKPKLFTTFLLGGLLSILTGAAWAATVLLDMTILAQALSNFLDNSELVANLQETFADVTGNLSEIYTNLSGLFGNLDLLSYLDPIACPGLIKFGRLFGIIAATSLLHVAVSKDWLFRVALRGKKRLIGKTGARRQFISIGLKVATLVLFYMLQTLCLTLNSLYLTVFGDLSTGPGPECADNGWDTPVWWVATVLSFPLTFLAICHFGLLFTGVIADRRQTIKFFASLKKNIAEGWCSATWKAVVFTGLTIKGIALMIVGFWNDRAFQTHKVRAKARLYNKPATSSDNQVETVMQLMARTRSLFLTIIPAGIILAKVTEGLNAQFVFVDPANNRNIFTPYKRRFFLAFPQIFKVAATVGIVFVPSSALLYLTFGALVPGVIWSVVDVIRDILAEIQEVVPEVDLPEAPEAPDLPEGTEPAEEPAAAVNAEAAPPDTSMAGIAVGSGVISAVNTHAAAKKAGGSKRKGGKRRGSKGSKGSRRSKGSKRKSKGEEAKKDEDAKKDDESETPAIDAAADALIPRSHERRTSESSGEGRAD